MKEWIVETDTPRLDRFLLNKLPTLSQGQLHRYLRQNKIKVNGKKIPLSSPVAAGSRICAYLPPDTLPSANTPNFMHAQSHLSIVFENDAVLIADKPAGLLTLDETAQTPDTLQNRVRRSLYSRNSLSQHSFLPRVCHRLDTGTSGLVLIAKTEQAEHELCALLASRAIIKEYLCVVVGHPTPSQAKLRAYQKKFPAESRVKVFSHPQAGAKTIITQYSTLASTHHLSLLKVHLITGRTHQIRAHMAFIGTPVLGDSKYGFQKENRAYKMKYQALCAYQLRFPQLSRGACCALSNKTFTAAMPWYAQQILDGTLK